MLAGRRVPSCIESGPGDFFQSLLDVLGIILCFYVMRHVFVLEFEKLQREENGFLRCAERGSAVQQPEGHLTLGSKNQKA